VKKRVIITGGAGFIGSHLANFLNKKNFEVIVYDNLSNGSGKKNLASNIQLVKGSILNYKKMKSVFKNIDMVYNLAVLPLAMSFDKPDSVVRVNDYGTYLVSKICSEFNIKLIHVSSSEAYGTARYKKMDESHPLLPTTVYAASKASSESYVRAFEKTDGLESVILRPFNSYGEFMREDGYGSVIPLFLNRLKKNLKPIIFGTGNQTRDLTHVSDTVNGIYRASMLKQAIGGTFNIAQGKEITINELAKIVIKEYSNLTGKETKLNFIYKKERSGDVRRHLGDISLSKKVLNYKPEMELTKGINQYLSWRLNYS
jgi:UDP-glucose 4-epimerase